MTYVLNTNAHGDAPLNIAGPYSPWPRKPRRIGRKVVIAGSVGTLAVFLHCIAPMMV